MSGAFESEFQGRGQRPRYRGADAPIVTAACADWPAEAIVIGGLLADDTLYDDAADRLRSEDFSDHLFADVFSAIGSMRGAGEVTSPITVARRLAQSEDLIERGGAKYLATLAAAEHADRARGHIEHLIDLARRRFLILAMQEIAPNVGDTSLTIQSGTEQLEAALSTVLSSSASRPAIGFAQAWDSAIKRVEALKAGEPDGRVVLTGLTEWNDICGGGMFMSQLMLLGGRPGMGKTAVALTVARSTAEDGHGVLFISLEMSIEQLMMRMVADMLFEAGSNATMNDVVNGTLSLEDFDIAARIRARIEDWPLVFEQPSGPLTASGVATLVRRHKRLMAQRGKVLRLVVVDYLGLLAPQKGRQNREQEMGDASRELKSTARTNDVVVLALAQLNRGVEQRDNKEPVLSDLRDSGSLEQDADTVVFAYRAEYYLTRPGAEPPPGDKRREAWEIEVASERDRLKLYSTKVRQGELATRKMYFFGKRQAIRPEDFYRNGGWGSR